MTNCIYINVSLTHQFAFSMTTSRNLKINYNLRIRSIEEARHSMTLYSKTIIIM